MQDIKTLFDGLIITGAPVEQMEYEDVDYWEEIRQIFEWTKSHVTSTLHLCWGHRREMYYHYGLKKYLLSVEKFGVYEHRVMNWKVPLVRGLTITLWRRTPDIPRCARRTSAKSRN